MRATLDRAAGRSAAAADAGTRSPRAAGTPRYLTGAQPWRRGETVVAALVAAISIGGLVWCWFRASDKVAWRDQLGWVSGAVLFTTLFVISGVCWTALGMRRLRAGFRVLGLHRREAFELDAAVVDVSVTAVLAASTELVTAASMRRVHRPDCLLLRGKTALPVAADDLDGYLRCGVCSS